jgi:hypothetical protein
MWLPQKQILHFLVAVFARILIPGPQASVAELFGMLSSQMWVDVCECRQFLDEKLV